MEINNILLETLKKKESSIIDFWKTKQKEIGISKLDFWIQLNKSVDFYYNEIEKKSRKKNLPTSESLKKLEQSLLKWADEIKPFIYYYNYKRSNVIAVNNSSIWKQYEFISNLNIVSFNYELKNKTAEEITEFLDFHLRNFKRQYEKFSKWNELLAEWFSHTKKQIPATFTPHQKDRFLTWFESQNKSTPKKSNKISSPTKALFCKIVSELEIIKKHETEANGTYCKKVCNSFGFEYVDRVRQNFNNALTQNAKKQIEKLLLPLLEAETRNKIKDYLNKPKQK